MQTSRNRNGIDSQEAVMAGSLYIQIREDVVDQIIRYGLSKTESKLFFYLFKLDRFGDGHIKVRVKQILDATGIGKTAYHAAVAKFQEMGWFDFDHSDAEITNLSTPPKKTKLVSLQNSAKTNHSSAKTNHSSAKTNHNSEKTNHNSEKTNYQRPESLLGAGSSASQTIQTYTDFIQTLSEGERADFKDFCRKETDNYPRPIINLGDYLASKDSNGQPRYLDFWERFRAGAAPRAGAADAEQAWKEVLGYAAKYSRYLKETWIQNIDCDSAIKAAVQACGGLSAIAEASSTQLFGFKQIFKEHYHPHHPHQPYQPAPSISTKEAWEEMWDETLRRVEAGARLSDLPSEILAIVRGCGGLPSIRDAIESPSMAEALRPTFKREFNYHHQTQERAYAVPAMR